MEPKINRSCFQFCVIHFPLVLLIVLFFPSVNKVKMEGSVDINLLNYKITFYKLTLLHLAINEAILHSGHLMLSYLAN